MAKKRKCSICGYPIGNVSGVKTKKGVACVGCFEQKYHARIKTAQMLGVPENELKDWLNF